MVRRRAATVETENNDEEITTETEDTGAADETNGGSGAGDSGLESRIRDIVREVVAPLLEGGAGNGHRQVDDEGSMTSRVRAALDEVKAEEERENRFKKVEETLEKVTERPPARSGILGKVQRVMWGEAE